MESDVAALVGFLDAFGNANALGWVGLVLKYCFSFSFGYDLARLSMAESESLHEIDMGIELVEGNFVYEDVSDFVAGSLFERDVLRLNGVEAVR